MKLTSTSVGIKIHANFAEALHTAMRITALLAYFQMSRGTAARHAHNFPCPTAWVEDDFGWKPYTKESAK